MSLSTPIVISLKLIYPNKRNNTTSDYMSQCNDTKCGSQQRSEGGENGSVAAFF